MSDNLIKTLREKTEEGDLDTILKTTFGGYSRKSVREYISMMRQQQYDMQQSFAEELQMSQTERERLAWELAEANSRTAAAEKELAQAKNLMEKAAGLERDMDEAIARIQSDGDLLEQQREELQRLRDECDMLRDRLEKGEAEICALKGKDISCSNECSDDAAQVQRAEGSGDDIREPVDQQETLQVRIAILTRERENTEKRLESVIRQERSLFQALNECRTELENHRDQNRCMEAENKALSLRLAEQMGQNISLDREITCMRTMNENLKCKLEKARVQLSKYAGQDTGDLFPWDLEE